VCSSDLAILFQNGALPPLRATDIIRQAAEGLHAAHALGIVHRDLKPDNILISSDADGFDSVKVVDFGIAKATGERSQGVTRTGIVIGTPEYMSPEQLEGKELDGRSDLYSLALVAFNMLTGELPFPVASTGTMIRTRLTEPPKTLAEVRRDVSWPNEVQTVLSRALEREPDSRQASTREFARTLHAAIVTMPTRVLHAADNRGVESDATSAATVVSRPSARAKKTSSSAHEQRRILMIAAALALPILIAVVLGSRGYIQRSRAHSAIEAGVTALREGRGHDAKASFVAAMKIAPSDPMPHVYLSRAAREENDLTAANDEAVKAVRLGPENGPALRELATTLYAMQNFSGARAFYARAIKADAADRISQGYLGCSLIQLGRADEGMRWIQRAGSGTWSACARASSLAKRDP